MACPGSRAGTLANSAAGHLGAVAVGAAKSAATRAAAAVRLHRDSAADQRQRPLPTVAARVRIERHGWGDAEAGNTNQQRLSRIQPLLRSWRELRAASRLFIREYSRQV